MADEHTERTDQSLNLSKELFAFCLASGSKRGDCRPFYSKICKMLNGARAGRICKTEEIKMPFLFSSLNPRFGFQSFIGSELKVSETCFYLNPGEERLSKVLISLKSLK